MQKTNEIFFQQSACVVGHCTRNTQQRNLFYLLEFRLKHLKNKKKHYKDSNELFENLFQGFKYVSSKHRRVHEPLTVLNS